MWIITVWTTFVAVKEGNDRVTLEGDEDTIRKLHYCFLARRSFSADTVASVTSSSALATSNI